MTAIPTRPSERLSIRAAGRTAAASPLRYPGGKAALATFFGDLIERLGIENARYVEPYAGGAGAGVALLLQDRVQDLVINDVDPAVYCFWKSVVQQPDAFAALITDTALNVEEWRAQKATYRAADESDPLALGFAFFYLNRTNRSGILNAGPIGGVNQTGNYKINARYNPERLADRVAAIGEVGARITVLCRDRRSAVPGRPGRVPVHRSSVRGDGRQPLPERVHPPRPRRPGPHPGCEARRKLGADLRPVGLHPKDLQQP